MGVHQWDMTARKAIEIARVRCSPLHLGLMPIA